MRAFAIENQFGLENLNLCERSDPAPGPFEVQLRMLAASLNFRDLLVVTGAYNPKQPLPLIPLSDGVGEVVKIGSAVTRFKVGDRVCPILPQKWFCGELTKEKLRSFLGSPVDGVLAEKKVFSEEGLVVVPKHLSHVEAATLPCAALTAWSAIISHGNLNPGNTVVLQGTGGVSLFALQFAKMIGAFVILTSSSDEKLEKAKQLGADHVINYKRNEKWAEEVKEVTGGVGADLVVDVALVNTLQQSINAVRVNGQISLVGNLSGNLSSVNLVPVLMRNIRIQGVTVGNRHQFQEMNAAILRHRLVPVVDKIFSFEKSREAFAYLKESRHMGKICIEF